MQEYNSLSPHGESGLKSNSTLEDSDIALGLSPHGESGLKSAIRKHGGYLTPRLSPHGESGLKSSMSYGVTTFTRSLPAWGEWIEMMQ